MSATDASTTSEALVTTDSMGVFTHGTKLLAGYINRLQGGGYQVAGTPRIEREGPGWAVIDGDSTLGQVGGMFATQVALTKARNVGVSYVGLKNSGHIGAAGYFAAVAARSGMICHVVGNDIPSVAGPGSRGPVLGSNPFAYGIPVQGGDPILLDMATAAVAGGKVYAAIQRGEAIPPTWIIDQAGHPTTDGSLYPKQASLAPMAGYKGYGLGLWAEILSAVLPGGAMTWQVGTWMFDPPHIPSRHNAGIMMIDAHAVADPSEFAERIKHVTDEIHRAPTAEGIERVLLPGEREWKLQRQAQTRGIDLPEDVKEKLRLAAKLVDLEPPV